MAATQMSGKFYDAELRIYQCLGVKGFRRGILRLERRKHRKDGGQNSNYHPRSTSVAALKSFTGYLLYNAILHGISLLFAVVYLALCCLSCVHHLWADILVAAVTVLNLYCIMLQRYTFLRMRAYLDRCCRKRDAAVSKAAAQLTEVLQHREEPELFAEFELIRRLQKTAREGTDTLLAEADAPVLERIAMCLERSGLGAQSLPRKKQRGRETDTFSSMPALEAEEADRCGVVERRVSRLQKALHREKTENVLFCFSLVTENGRCERAYRRVFPEDSRDGIERRLAMLALAYRQAAGEWEA